MTLEPRGDFCNLLCSVGEIKTPTQCGAKTPQNKYLCVGVYELPILVQSRPDIIFIENVIMAVFGHCVEDLGKSNNALREMISSLMNRDSTALSSSHVYNLFTYLSRYSASSSSTATEYSHSFSVLLVYPGTSSFFLLNLRFSPTFAFCSPQGLQATKRRQEKKRFLQL